MAAVFGGGECARNKLELRVILVYLYIAIFKSAYVQKYILFQILPWRNATRQSDRITYVRSFGRYVPDVNRLDRVNYIACFVAVAHMVW